jgi:carboxyl-terminal processing protease
LQIRDESSLSRGRPPPTRRGGACWRIALVFVALLATGGCAAPDPPLDDARALLFAGAYRQVMEYYIEPRTAREAALPALAQLSTLAPGIAVAPDVEDIVLRDAGAPVARYPAPEARDAKGWGALTAALWDAARKRSAALAALPPAQVEQALLDGLTLSLDRFSRYADPDAARRQRAEREGFEGIGVTLDDIVDPIRVAAVIAGGPADRAGIRAGDRIVAIDGAAPRGLPRDEIMRRLRGPADSRIALTIARPRRRGRLLLSLARAYIIAPTVTVRRDGDIAVLRVAGFNGHTTDALREAVEALRAGDAEPLRGLVLDLRGNPGGLLEQGVSVADLFLSGGRIAATQGRSEGSDQTFDAGPGQIAAGIPMAVAIDGGSASSAEIVAAALQDSGRAVIVGSSSYGKGTVQTILPLPNGGELILTWARLVAPGGYLLNAHGIVPAVCTSGVAERPAAIAALLRRSPSRAFRSEARAGLSEAGWSRLRHSCPGETGERRIDLDAAERLLDDPPLYARLLHAETTAVAARHTKP